MFNLDKMKIIKGNERDKKSYSFVGIKRNLATNQLEFWLPLGFENFPHNDKNSVKKLFFRMYKTFNIFSKNIPKSKNIDKNRDGVIQATGGFKIKNSDNSEVICYSKISMLENIIDAYDDLRISSIIKANFVTEDVDFNKINNYLDKCIYLTGHIPYIDKMQLPQYRKKSSYMELVQLFCFIYSEIKIEMEEEQYLRKEVVYLSDKFKEDHLRHSSSLFNDNFDETLIILKNTLETIDKSSPYKDNDFLIFFEAIEKFIYGESYFDTDNDEGAFWGVNNFWSIWEDMCFAYYFYKYKNTIAFADSKKYIDKKQHEDKKQYYLNTEILEENIFYISLNKDKIELRPDLVRFEGNSFNREKSFKEFFSIKENYSHGNLSDVSIIKDHNNIAKKIFRTYCENKNIRISSKKNNTVKIKNVSKKDYDNLIEDVKNRILTKNEITISDFKYHSYIDYDKKPIKNKVKSDIVKNLVYEAAARCWRKDAEFTNQICVPYYKEIENNSIEITNISKIKIGDISLDLVKIDFNAIQEYYIKNDL